MKLLLSLVLILAACLPTAPPSDAHTSTEATVESFYRLWISSPPHKPMRDRYRKSMLITDAFRERLDGMSSDILLSRAVLCSRVEPSSIEAHAVLTETGALTNRVTVTEHFGDGTVIADVTLRKVGDGWKIDAVECNAMTTENEDDI